MVNRSNMSCTCSTSSRVLIKFLDIDSRSMSVHGFKVPVITPPGKSQRAY